MMTRGKIGMLIVLTVLVLTQMVFVEAETGMAQPLYTSTDYLRVDVQISGTKVQVTSEAKGITNDTTTRLTVNLQKRQAGGSAWSTLATWSDKASGRARASVLEKYSATKGNDYRVKAVSKIVSKEGVILETVTKYSGIKSY